MDAARILEGRLDVARHDRNFAFTAERVEPFVEQLEDQVGASRVPDEVLRPLVHLAQVLQARAEADLPKNVRRRESADLDERLSGRVLETLHRWEDAGQIASFEDGWLQGPPVVVEDGSLTPNGPAPTVPASQLAAEARTNPDALAELVRQADPAWGWQAVRELTVLAADAAREPALKEALRPHLASLTTVASRAEARGLLDRDAMPALELSRNLLDLFPEAGGRDFLLREMRPLLTVEPRAISSEATDFAVRRWGPGATFDLLLHGSGRLGAAEHLSQMESAIARGLWLPDRDEAELLIARLDVPAHQSVFESPGQEFRMILRLLDGAQERKPDLLEGLDVGAALLERVCADPKPERAEAFLCDTPSARGYSLGSHLAALAFAEPGVLDRTLDRLAAEPRPDRVGLAVVAHQPLTPEQQVRFDGIVARAGLDPKDPLLDTSRSWRLWNGLARLSPRQAVEHPEQWRPLAAGLPEPEVRSQLQQAWLDPRPGVHHRLARAVKEPANADTLHPFLEEGVRQDRLDEVAADLERCFEVVGGRYASGYEQDAAAFYGAARNRLPEAIAELERVRELVPDYSGPTCAIAAWKAVTGPDLEARLDSLRQLIEAVGAPERAIEILPDLQEGDPARLAQLMPAFDLDSALAALPLARDPERLNELLELQERLHDAGQAMTLLPDVGAVGTERGLAVVDRVRERFDAQHQEQAVEVAGEVLRGIAAGRREDDCLQESLQEKIFGEAEPPAADAGRIQAGDEGVWVGAVRLDVRP